VLAVLVLALVTSVLGAIAPASAAPGDPACIADAAKPGVERPPISNSAPTPGSYFSYPNRSTAEKYAIRNRVINLINSTWGRYYDRDAVPKATQVACIDANNQAQSNHQYVAQSADWNAGERAGTIRLATWSYNDPGIHNAIKAAVERGTSVGVLAARGINAEKKYKPWMDTKALLSRGRDWAKGGQHNFASECSGACRGNGGGTPHSKYYLFSDVGPSHAGTADNPHPITLQTSMNLTTFAYQGQWNAGYVFNSQRIYNRFLAIFNESVLRSSSGYRASTDDGVANYFYPGGSLNNDVAMRALAPVTCTGATSGGINGRTRIRVIQYAIYDTRGVMLAKRLRQLWNAGCNVAIIYSVTSRPVLQILRAKSGRGPVPMKQSVVKNGRGEIVKYNHSKWLAITGNYAGNRGNWTVMSGSSNWSNFAYSCDEAIQQVYGFGFTAPFIRTFDTTWAQKTSKKPTYGGSLDGGRIGARGTATTFGYGQFKYMDND
jgi:hypothetical protein